MDEPQPDGYNFTTNDKRRKLKVTIKDATEETYLKENPTQQTVALVGGLPWLLVRLSLSALAMFHFENPRLCLRCSQKNDRRKGRVGDLVTVRTEKSKNYGSIKNWDDDDTKNRHCVICEDLRPKTELLYDLKSKNVRKVFCGIVACILTVAFVLHPLLKVYFRWANPTEILYLFYFIAFFTPPLLIIVSRGLAILDLTKVTKPSIDTGPFKALSNDFIHGLLNRTNDKFVPLKGSVRFWGLFYNVCVLVYIGLYTSFQVSVVWSDCPEYNGWGVYGCIMDMMGVLVFSEFWYLVYLLRLALQLELDSLCGFVTSNVSMGTIREEMNENRTIQDADKRLMAQQESLHVDQPEGVYRRRIMETFLDFTRLNNLVIYLITVTMSATIFKGSCHLYWNFHVFHTYDETFRVPALLINLTVWDSILMFLILPLVSVGSININYIWDDFVNYLDYELEEGKRWLVDFAEKKKCGSNSAEIAMLALTAVSIFVAFSFPVEQYGKYWTEDSICKYIVYNDTMYPF